MKQEETVALEIIRGSNIEPKEVEWLWYPYIPFGKVTIIQGEPDQRILAVQKCNLAEKGASILFSVEDGKVTWISEVEMTADELVGASGAEHGRPSVRQEKAAEILKEILANGAVPQKKIEGMLREHGISHSTAKIVKRRLGIESVKPEGQHYWYWRLPEEIKELEENEEGNNLTGTQRLSG